MRSGGLLVGVGLTLAFVEFLSVSPRRHVAALLVWQAVLAGLWLAGYAR